MKEIVLPPEAIETSRQLKAMLERNAASESRVKTDGMEITLPDGIHETSRETYDRLNRTNWSSLKHIGRSPAHYRHNRMVTPPDKDAFRIGRCTHRAVYEPERFAVEVAVWDDGPRRGPDWRAFSRKHAGRDILKEDERKQCLDIAAAVRGDAVASRYVSGGQGEVTVLWTDALYRESCKARVDFIANCGALVDLKTCRDASPEGFGREVARWQYHVQAAWYADGHAEATGKRLPYVLVAVEKEPPHVVAVYRVPDPILELGRDSYRELLGRLLDCRKESRWPGYSTMEQDLTLPRWAVPDDENDVSDLGLVVGE